MPTTGRLSAELVTKSFYGTESFPALLPRSLSPLVTYHREEMLRLLAEDWEELIHVLFTIPEPERADWEILFLEEDVCPFVCALDTSDEKYTLTPRAEKKAVALYLNDSISLLDLPIAHFSEKPDFPHAMKTTFLSKLAALYKGELESTVDPILASDFTESDWILLAIASPRIEDIEQTFLLNVRKRFIETAPYQEAFIDAARFEDDPAIWELNQAGGCCAAVATKTYLSGVPSGLSVHTRNLQSKHMLSTTWAKYIKSPIPFHFPPTDYSGFEPSIGESLGFTPTVEMPYADMKENQEYMVCLRFPEGAGHVMYVNTKTHTLYDPNLYDKSFRPIPRTLLNFEELKKYLDRFILSFYPGIEIDKLTLECMVPNASEQYEAFEALRMNTISFFESDRTFLVRQSLRYGTAPIMALAVEKLSYEREGAAKTIVSELLKCGHDYTRYECEWDSFFTKEELERYAQEGREHQRAYIERRLHRFTRDEKALIYKRAQKKTEDVITDETLLRDLSLTNFYIQNFTSTQSKLRMLRLYDEYDCIIHSMKLRGIIEEDDEVYLIPSIHLLQTIDSLDRTKILLRKLSPGVESRERFFKFISYRISKDPTKCTDYKDIFSRSKNPLQELLEGSNAFWKAGRDCSYKKQTDELIEKYDLDLQPVLIETDYTKDAWNYGPDEPREKVLNKIIETLSQ